MTTDQKKEVQKMREEGQSYKQIALALGISKNTIKSFCRRNGFTTCKNSTFINNLSKGEKEIYAECKNCGKPLKHGTKGQPPKFCSEECRRNWWKNNENQLVKKAYYTIICAGCGKMFISYGNKSRKYCSHACYINGRFRKGRHFND